MAEQFVGQPGERHTGVAQCVRAFALRRHLAASADLHCLGGQVYFAPVGRHSGPEHHVAGTGKVGNQLRLASGDKVLVTGIGYFNRQMQFSHLRHDLLNGQRRIAHSQHISTHAKSKFGFDDMHDIATHGNRCAIGQATRSQQTPCQRTADTDMRLACAAGGRNFPAYGFVARGFKQGLLDRVALASGLGTHAWVDRFNLMRGLPRRQQLQSSRVGCQPYHWPTLGMEAQGSAGGSGALACNNSTETPSGERTKAI